MQVDKLNEYLEGLNGPQREAVLATQGPVLVIAGAGSGKTRVLTLRIAYLLSQGVRPYNILALTFTNKAAREMKERIAGIVGPDVARGLWMGTFHSIFARILRMEADRLGISPDFSIYDTADSKSVIKNILKGLNMTDDQLKKYTPQAVLGAISAAKNDLVMPDAFANNPKYVDKERPRLAELYRLYVEECQKANALDFDDLLLKTNILFRDVPDALAKYQDKFQYVLVDEYQDTNLSQYTIINRLAKARQNICVVGDDAQSIYSFRGARIENILNFRTDYPQCRLFKLEQNYRSTQNIVGAANKLIANNVGQIPKNVFSDGDDGDKIAVWPCATDRMEAGKVVADVVIRMRTEHKRPSDFAVLYRTNSQSRVFEDEFRQAGVPYKIYGGLAFYQRAEIRDVMAYLRLTVNRNDTESLRRIINVPKRQIGPTTVDKIESYARASNIPMWDVMSQPRLLAQVGLNNPTQARISRFVALIDLLAQQAYNLDAYTFSVEVLSQSGLLQELNAKKTDPDEKERFSNVQELLNGIKEYTENQTELGEETNVRGFIQQVSLISDLDEEDGKEHVSLMTIHSAKGLEFDTVYIVGVEEEIFPGDKHTLDPQGVEEERRLMYVALTRAKNNCVVSYATSRFLYGQTKQSHPSRFIAELDPEFCEKPREQRPACTDDGFGGFRYGGRGYSNSYGGGGSSFNRQQPASYQPKFQRGSYQPQSRPTPSRETPFTPGSKFRSLGVRSSEPEKELDRTPDGQYAVGTRVMHDRFGTGMVTAIFCSGQNDIKLRIVFDNTKEEKTLLLKFARIKPI